MTLAPGSVLGPYTLRAELGRGGMGVVYTAHDPRLDRQVAIKVLPPDLTRDETAKQRFLREAKAASALDHPNICTIHEINETDDGQLYLVMAHYEGETLEERIDRGALPLEDAIDIATQVGLGLAEAHGAGIVHRDIKPANLLMTQGGVVKILDFGLAKLAGTEGVTQTGTTMGTVAYMSPEQAAGEDADPRTDIWALGVVFYEMLAGVPPFRGDSLLAIADAIRRVAAAPLPEKSAVAQPVIDRALEKDRTRRYPTAVELLEALRPLGTTTAVTVASPAPPTVPSIAVLPFADMSPAQDQAYFCEGIAEEILNALTGVRGLRVAARTSAFLAKAKGFDIAEIGNQLHVGAVLEGSVRTAARRLRVTAQLIDVANGYHMWSERFDRDLDDVFAVQEEIARAIAGRLQADLVGEPDARLVTRPAESVDAYARYLEGRHHLARMTVPGLERALVCYEQALALEPTNARAHAGIACAWLSLAQLSAARPLDVMPGARAAAERALALDDTVAEAHFALGFVLASHDWTWAAAEAAFRRSLEINPVDPLTHVAYAELLGCLGRHDESVAEARHAVTDDPLSPLAHGELAMILSLARRFEEAVAEGQVCLELAPQYVLAHCTMATAWHALGRVGQAVDAVRRAAALAPTSTFVQSFLGWGLGLAGERSGAQAILGELEARRRREYVSGTAMARIHVGAGEYEEAITSLERAAAERDSWLPVVAVSAAWDPLRGDARFQGLLRRLQLPAPPPY